MSGLALAHSHLRQAVDELEREAEELPCYDVETLRFLRKELRAIVRRLESIRAALGDG